MKKRTLIEKIWKFKKKLAKSSFFNKTWNPKKSNKNKVVVYLCANITQIFVCLFALVSFLFHSILFYKKLKLLYYIYVIFLLWHIIFTIQFYLIVYHLIIGVWVCACVCTGNTCRNTKLVMIWVIDHWT